MMHSRPSFSPNKRKRSEMERSFAVSGDMIVVASKSDLAPRCHRANVPGLWVSPLQRGSSEGLTYPTRRVILVYYPI